jgi:hypothetical protein
MNVERTRSGTFAKAAGGAAKAAGGAAKATGATAGAAEAGEERAAGAGEERTGAGEAKAAGAGEERAGAFLDPVETFRTGEEQTGKRRGRPPGSKARHHKAGKASSAPSLEGIESILLSLHLIAAKITHIDELELSEEESKRLSDALSRVAVLYDIEASEKTLAWLNLALCCGSIYGTRMMAYSLRTRTEEESKKKGSPVLHFPSTANSNSGFTTQPGFTGQQPAADSTM